MTHTKGSWRSRSTILKVAAFATAAGLLATPVLAVHKWSTYHWKRTTTQISPPVGDNVNSNWDSYLTTAVNDWNASTRIQSTKVAGTTTPSTCAPKAGRIEVCNYAYGSTGWLGIASVWLSADGHISQATTKLNDSYYGSGSSYNTPAWRAAVTCQEIGHDYGLAHQDEDFSTDATNSCMEYTNVPAGNEHPDQHDYDQIASIYSHVHAASNLPGAGFNSLEPNAAPLGNTRESWGNQVGHHRFERDLGQGRKVITDVLFVDHAKGH
ncbi:MAG TPA: hypothetical protein VE053_14745 [Allosphingosinicella sp.]|nr:hypothetical protein [Allosphingosinicella sp.]